MALLAADSPLKSLFKFSGPLLGITMQLKNILNAIIFIAKENNMEVFIEKFDSKDHSQPRSSDPSRELLKICPIGVKNSTLLEIELVQNNLKIWRHRNSGLTERYKGYLITQEWVEKFIVHNKDLAGKYIQDQKEIRSCTLNTKYEVRCTCNGTNEKCFRCFGTGKHKIDGFGNFVKG